MPSEAVRALHCLVRSQGRQVLLLTARTAVYNLLLKIHYKRLDLWAAAERWDQALTELDSILSLLNRADRDLRTAISELSVYTLTIGDRGGCLALFRKLRLLDSL